MGLIALAVLCLAPRATAAGPWTRNLGQFYLRLGEDLFLANSYVDSAGRVVTGTAYLGASTALYAEVGLYRGLQVVAYLPYVVARNTFDDGTGYLNVGGGDAQFSLQWTPPIKSPFPWAIRLEFKVPFHDVGGIRGPLADRFPALGDGQLDVTTWLSAGYAHPRWPLFWFIELGYRHRTEHYVGRGQGRHYGDGIALLTQIGYTIRKRATVSLALGGVFSFRPGEFTKSYLYLGPSLAVALYRGLSVDIRFAPIPWASNSSRGYSFGFGVSYQR